MKLPKHEQDRMKEAIHGLFTREFLEGEAVLKYEQGNFANADKVKDLQRRFCFDVLAITVRYKRINTNRLYREYNLTDEHLYTALKRILPKVTKRY